MSIIFGGRLEDYLTGESEEEENAVPSATESRVSPQPQTLDVGPFYLSLLNINPNQYQPSLRETQHQKLALEFHPSRI